MWTPIYSWYEWLWFSGKGFMVANTPCEYRHAQPHLHRISPPHPSSPCRALGDIGSGHFEISAPVWVAAMRTMGRRVGGAA